MNPVREFIDDSRESPQILSDAHAMVREVVEHREDIDRILARHARHWETSRLALVDRNILRLGVMEMLFAKVPAKVAISEALHLAQEFSSADSPRFVNGVLDAVAKEIANDLEQGGQTPAPS